MNKYHLLSVAAAFLLAGGVMSTPAWGAAVPSVGTPGVAAWENPEKLQGRLGEQIVSLLPGLSTEQVQGFIRDPENLRLLVMYYIARAETGAQEGYKRYNESLKQNVKNKQAEIERHEKDVKARSGSEKLRAQFLLENARTDLKKLTNEARYPAGLSQCDKVLKAILADVGWMEQLAFSGEMHNFTRVVQIINAIAAGDAAALKKGVERDICTAVALEYARNGARLTDAVDRARYFLKYWRQGRLNTSFDKLPMHHRRVACGWKPDHNSGTVKAFEWALDNVHLPDWQYPASCWRCGYVLDNVFGDSVQGPSYYAPWAGLRTDNHMWLAKNVGAVCGGLSHFGAASACANGVPALASGEPAHCSYIVLVNGTWTPAYSLSWERGLHWIPWSNNWTYSALHLTDDLYATSAAARTRLAQAYRILAAVYRNRDDDAKALQCYEASAKAAPLNYPMWREYSAFLVNRMPQNKEAWAKLHVRLCMGMASCYPEQAAELLKQCVYNNMAVCGLSAKQLTAACAQFWKYADKMGPDRWRIEEFIDRQLRLCKDAAGGSEDAVISLYAKVLAAAAPHDAYAGSMMSWGNKLSASLSQGGQKRLSDSTIKVLGSGKDVSSAQKAKLLGGLMLAAEKARDTSTFYAISKMIDPKEIHGTADIPAPTPFPGKLVSEGGLPFASSTSEWDAPHTHSGLLTQKGGKIHTGKDTNAWIAVKLPRHAYITGVVFAGTNEWGLIHRFRPLRVQVSDTGNADDWHDVGAEIPSTGNYINRFDLQQERPKALYVRVLRSGGPEFFHANGIYVYGEPAA